MTRYARFPSLKGKNQRFFEESTPWDKLKIAGKKNQRSNNRKTNGVQNNSTRNVNDGEVNRNNKNRQKKKNCNNSNINKFINWKLKGDYQGNASNEEDSNNSSKEQDKSGDTISNKNNEIFSRSKMKFKQFKNGQKSHKNLSRKKENGNNCSNNFESDSTNLNESGYKRRKPLSDIPSIYVDNVETEIARFGGFPVKKSDAERLRKLKSELVSMKIPRDEREALLKAERRRAEKALARERKKICFQCRRSGHILSQCPELANADEGVGGNLTAGICFKCGSTEHKINECQVVSENYKFAVCFICKEEGHLSKQCPDNPRGLYPEGGACRLCGDVTHLKKDCPRFVKKKQDEFNVTAQIINNSAPEALDNDFEEAPHPLPVKKRKVIIMNK